VVLFLFILWGCDPDIVLKFDRKRKCFIIVFPLITISGAAERSQWRCIQSGWLSDAAGTHWFHG